MAADDPIDPQRSFIGTGWSFPPRFVAGTGEALGRVEMTSGREDIESSLHLLFGTAPGERFLVPEYGLDMRELLFEPLSTTRRTLLENRIRIAILVYEPRILLRGLRIDTGRAADGALFVEVEYEIRATNSRYNLVIPFCTTEGNEVLRTARLVP
ncbi:MAG: GPW/gp25 family protein [bacterium]